MADSIRIYVTGSCDGLDGLREALASHPELDFVGWSDHVAEAAPALAGGHLQVVVHATRSASFPAGEVAAIREHTRSPIVILASGESSALLEEALDADGVADVLLLPQLTENVVFALRKAGHAGRRLQAEGGGTARHGRIITVFSPKGGTGKTVTATNLAASFAKHERRRTLLLDLDLQFGDAAIMLGLEPEKTIYDLVVAPGELDSEKLAGYITKHTCGLDVLPAPLRPGGCRARDRVEAGPAARGGAGVLRPDRRRHVPVLPRADAGDARPDGRAADDLRARRPDAEERAPVAADARAALLPRLPDPLRPQPRQLEGRDEEEGGRRGAQHHDRLRSPVRPGRAPRRQPRRCRPRSPTRGPTSRRRFARSPSRCSPSRSSRRRSAVRALARA